ncbi:hypothetical protein ACJIZ3_002427 [Penstemon smallii]|uniref:Alkyl transferase n=1 Tax=Penstemon smallii TaxID=265156 RepID=A0ABD3U6C5_9LAMI
MNTLANTLFGNLISFIRRILFCILSVGPIPNHVAFILDGNRRFAKKLNLPEGMGHRVGFQSLISVLRYCFDLGVKYVSVYAFSIDNFKRKPEEVQSIMDLMVEKFNEMVEEESIVYQYSVRVYIIGNLSLLSDNVRLAAEKVMKATSSNNKSNLIICLAYTSTDEIVHATQESCDDKWAKIQSSIDGEMMEGKREGCFVIKVADIERRMYMGVAPDPDILVRTSGETRLSNFLLWQTSNCMLYSPRALWPEIGFLHIAWAFLEFQRTYPYLEKKRKEL